VDHQGGNQGRQHKQNDFSALSDNVHSVLRFEDVDHDAIPFRESVLSCSSFRLWDQRTIVQPGDSDKLPWWVSAIFEINIA
jgi:hypothetical protein